MSRTPLREAFKVLAVEGLIEIQPNRGAIVSRIGPREARDMLTVISRLEALAGELACANATDAEIAGVRALHDRMMALFAQRERMLYFGVNQENPSGDRAHRAQRACCARCMRNCMRA